MKTLHLRPTSLIKQFVFTVAMLLGTLTLYAQQMVATSTNRANYYTFELPAEKIITAELDKLTPPEWKAHPDYGVLPHYAPCHNCVELIHKRTDSTRYFIENNTDGKKIYLQSGDNTMHFRDQNGHVREQIHLMFPTQTPHVFRSMLQPEPLEIDIPQQQVAIYREDGKKLTFNKNLELWAITSNDQKIRLAVASWKNGYTAGANGVRINNVFPDIDLEVNNQIGGVKTNFVVKNNAGQWQQYRYIFIKDELFSGLATHCDFVGQPNADQLYVGDAHLYDAFDKRIGTVEKGLVYDARQYAQRDVFYEWDKGFNVYVKTDIFSDPHVTYPITIDPTVTITSTLPLSSLGGSKYDAICWNPDEYCAYPLNVNFPPNVSFTDVKVLGGFSAPYLGYSYCPFNSGAMRIVTNNCISPLNPDPSTPKFWKCTGDSTLFNACHFVGPDNSIYDELKDCLPSPACTTQTQIFDFRLFRCKQDAVACWGDCIKAYEPFIITIVGETLELTALNIDDGTTSSTICKGDTIVLKPNDQFGVPPYAYTWTPGGETTDSIIVSPQALTIYTITITDACNNTKSASQMITVVPIKHDTTQLTICEKNLPFAWNAHTITEPGDYFFSDTTTTAGCHSTENLILTVHPANTVINTTICSDLLPYKWEKHTINSVGQHTLYDTVKLDMCSSVATHYLTVDPVIRLNIDSVVCVTEFPFVWMGQEVHEMGSYVLTDTNVASNGCDSLTSLYLIIQCDIFPPNVLSFSSELGNNEWFVEEGGFAEFRCAIVNRWGRIVYELSDAKQRWRGEDKNGNRVSEGVYFYMITAKYKDGREVVKHGTIHVEI